jgi:hypothetical protein
VTAPGEVRFLLSVRFPRADLSAVVAALVGDGPRMREATSDE